MKLTKWTTLHAYIWLQYVLVHYGPLHIDPDLKKNKLITSTFQLVTTSRLVMAVTNKVFLFISEVLLIYLIYLYLEYMYLYWLNLSRISCLFSLSRCCNCYV